MSFKLGFIGAGNMGGALLRAALKTTAPENIAVCEKNPALLSEIEALGCKSVDSITIANECEFIFLAVKPQIMPIVCGEIGDVLIKRTTPYTVISMAAGLSTDKIFGFLGGEIPLIRIMPNTPAMVNEGMILYCPTSGVNDDSVAEFLNIMAKAGRFDKIDEKFIDAASAVSGCGPAFVYMFIEAMADGGVLCGLTRKQAMDYAAQTLLGSAKMVLESGEHPGLLKDRVCSPGGTTIAGVRALEENGFRSAAMNAVIAAYDRTLELGK